MLLTTVNYMRWMGRTAPYRSRFIRASRFPQLPPTYVARM
jgi:hypothetical protein